MDAANYTAAAAEVTTQLGLAIAGGVAILGTIIGLRVGIRIFKGLAKG